MYDLADIHGLIAILGEDPGAHGVHVISGRYNGRRREVQTGIRGLARACGHVAAILRRNEP
jgi:hypothetical protein